MDIAQRASDIRMIAGVGGQPRTLSDAEEDILFAEKFENFSVARANQRNEWTYADPVYDLAASVLSVAQFMHVGDITIPAGKQYNFFRVDGIFRGGDKAKGLNFEFDVYSCDDAYGVIGLLNNRGAGPTKALYGRSVAKSGCTGIVVGGVSGVTVDNGATPSAAYGHQISMAGDGAAGVTNFGHVALRINTDNNILGINNGVIVIDEGIFSDNRVGYSDAFIRAVNGTVGTDTTQTQAAGSFLKWQDVGGQFLFEVDKDGLIYQRATDGKQLFATDIGGNLIMGSTNVSQRRLQLYTSATEYYFSGVNSGNYTRIRDNTLGNDLMRLAGGGAADALSIRVNSTIKQVTEGAADSGGAGFKVLRVPNA